jgi:hypothetical protein
LCFLLVSCQKDEGAWVEKKIELKDFSTVVFNDIFDILLVQDTVNYVIASSGENLIGNILFTENNGVLEFWQKAETNWNRSYRHTYLELHFENLNNVFVKNCINLKSADTLLLQNFAIDDHSELSEIDIKINCDNLSMAVYGENCGIYKVSGNAQNCALQLEGSAHFITDDLTVDSAYVLHNGIGDCFVNASKKLYGKILLDGVLKYKNHKGLDVNIQNKIGQLIAL